MTQPCTRSSVGANGRKALSFTIQTHYPALDAKVSRVRDHVNAGAPRQAPAVRASSDAKSRGLRALLVREIRRNDSVSTWTAFNHSQHYCASKQIRRLLSGGAGYAREHSPGY